MVPAGPGLFALLGSGGARAKALSDLHYRDGSGQVGCDQPVSFESLNAPRWASMS